MTANQLSSPVTPADDWQTRRAEALRAALNEVLRIADRYVNGGDTYHNTVHDIYSVVCRALNADAEMEPRYLQVRVPAPEQPHGE